jgi:hypothetical protein
MKDADVARVCHEANRAYCSAIGDDTQAPWLEAPQWQRDSACAGVVAFRQSGGSMSAEALHESWTAAKLADGWAYGPVKDATLKQHPCLVAYLDLPAEQRHKDKLFRAVCTALLYA